MFRRLKRHSKYERTVLPIGGILKTFFIFIFALLLPISPEIGDCNDLSLIPAITVREEYNNNLFLEEDDPTDDFITTISPKLSLIKKSERINTELLVRLDDVIYLDQDEFNAVDQFYNGYLNYRFNPRLLVSGNASFFRDSRADRDIETTGLTLGTATRDRQQYGISGSYVLTEKTSVALSGTYDDEKFDKPEYNDYFSNSVNIGMVHDIGDLIPRTLGRMNFGYNHYHFSSSKVDVFSLTLGIGREINEKISVLVDLGARYTESEFDVIQWLYYPYFYGMEEKTTSSWGGIGRISLSYKEEFNKFDLNVTHDIRAASGREGAVERTTINAGIEHNFTQKISGGLVGGYYLNQTEGNDLRYSTIDEIDEETFYFRCSLRWKFNPNISMNASYNYTQVIDNENDTDSQRNVFFVNASYRYPLFE